MAHKPIHVMATKNTVLTWTTNDFPEPVLLAWRAFDAASKAKMMAASSKTAKLPEEKRALLNTHMRFTEMKALSSLEKACEIFGLNPENACFRLEQLKPRVL